jgi:hypothetical protein
MATSSGTFGKCIIPFKIGDIVTRDGTDRQKIVEIHGEDAITVECTVAPKSGWCVIGQRELNLAGRYQYPIA